MAARSTDHAPAPARSVALRQEPRPAGARAAGSADAVSVAETVRVLLPHGRIAGGAAGLHRRVTWATSLRSRPPAFEPRGGGEFVLAPAAILNSLRQVDPTLSLSRILDGLAEIGAAALAVPAPAPVEAAATADALAIPLVEVVDGPSFFDLERQIIGLVLDRRNELQARASQFHHQLARLSSENRGLEAIVRAAAQATGRLAAYEDAQFRLRVAARPDLASPTPVADAAGLSSAEERGRLAAALRAQAPGLTPLPALLLPAARWGLVRYTAPVVTRDRIRGYFSLGGEAESLAEFDQLAAGRAAEIVAMELAKEDAVLAAEQRMQGDLVDELLHPFSDPAAAARRAAQAGIAMDGAFAVYALSLDPDDPHAPGPAARATLTVAAAEAIGRYAKRHALPALVKVEQDEVLVICQLTAGTPEDGPPAPAPAERAGAASNGAPRPAERAAGATREAAGDGAAESPEHLERRLRSDGEALLAAAREAAPVALAMGVSRAVHRLPALPPAAREAREAMRIGRHVYGPGKLVAYADLGLYRVLHALRESPELRTFYEQTLGPLAEYDRRTGQNLLETLEAFFACHGNLSQTAQRLQLHRNSLLYRIGRIREIGGVDLEDPETRLSLQVALKARRLLT